MKKTLLVVGIIVAILAALAVAGFAFAQKPTPNTPYSPGMMGGKGGGMMGAGTVKTVMVRCTRSCKMPWRKR